MSLLNGFKDIFKKDNQVNSDDMSKSIIGNTKNTTLAVLAMSYMLSGCGIKSIDNESSEGLKKSTYISNNMGPRRLDFFDTKVKESNTFVSDFTSSILLNGSSINYRNGDTSAYINYNVNNINTGININDLDSQLKLSIMGGMNETAGDYGLKASYAALYSAAKLGTYIGIEKGSDIEKIVISESIAISGGKVQMSYGLLKKIINTTFAKTGTSHKPKMTQNTIGLDYSKINISNIVRELKTSVVFYDVQNKNLGVIGNTIINNATLYDWTDIHGGIRGGNKLVAEIKAIFKLAKTFKIGISGGYEEVKYKSMFNTTSKSQLGANGGLDLTYQPSDYNRFVANVNIGKTSRDYKVEVRHDFGNDWEVFASAEKIDYKTPGIKSDTRGDIGLTYNFGSDGHSKLSPLFNNIDSNEELSLNDLKPNSLVDTNVIQAMKQVTFDEHMVKILKSSLTGASNLVLNANGTLQAVNLDSGVTNLVSISGVNFSQHLSHFSIQSGKFIHITGFEQLFVPATYKISALDTLGTVTVFTLKTVKGSVELTLVPTVVNGVTKANAAAYLAGTITLTQLQNTLQVPPTMGTVGSVTVANGGAVNIAVSNSVTLTNGDPILSYALTGTLPVGLIFNTTTGILSGSTTVAGTYNFSVTASDNDGASTAATFTVTVNAINTPPVLNLTITPSNGVNPSGFPEVVSGIVNTTTSYTFNITNSNTSSPIANLNIIDDNGINAIIIKNLNGVVLNNFNANGAKSWINNYPMPWIGTTGQTGGGLIVVFTDTNGITVTKTITGNNI